MASCGSVEELSEQFKRKLKLEPHLKTAYDQLVVGLRDELQKRKIASRVEYVGSTYKGTRTNASDIDNIFVKRDTDGLMTSIRSNTHPECVLISVMSNRINPNKTLVSFKGEIQKIINSMKVQDRVKLADHGPAIELRYFHDGWKAAGPKPEHDFSIDLVFSFEIKIDGEFKMFIAKPPKSGSGDECDLWKQSTALEEKEMMSNIDKDGTAGQLAIKILKSLREKEAPLQVLTSYIFEQVLYNLWKTKKETFWKKENIKEILKLMLTTIAEAAEKNVLKNKFNPKENVMKSITMSETARENIVQRLLNLAKDKSMDGIITKVMADTKAKY